MSSTWYTDNVIPRNQDGSPTNKHLRSCSLDGLTVLREQGDITSKEALYFGVLRMREDLRSKYAALQLMENGRWVRREVELVDWSDGKYADQYIWNSLGDFLEFMNAKLGCLLEFAAWFQQNLGKPIAEFERNLERFAAASAVAAHGTNQHREVGGDNVTSTPDPKPERGNAALYTVRRLKRDRPDLAERVIAGELSPNAAAIEAGIRRPTMQIPTDDPIRAAEAIRRRLGDEFLQALARAGAACSARANNPGFLDDR